MNEHRGTAAYERLVQVHKMHRRKLAVLRRAVGEWADKGAPVQPGRSHSGAGFA